MWNLLWGDIGNWGEMKMNKPNLEKEGLPHPLQQSLTPHLRCGTFEGNLLFAMYE